MSLHTQTSVPKPSLFISVTTSTVQDSLDGTGPICKDYFHLLLYTQLHPYTSAPSEPLLVLLDGVHRPNPGGLLQNSASYATYQL